MNHLEQLVSEWLQYNGYFVRMAVQVGPRPNGGFEGELDVVGFHVRKGHLIHIECSLDSDSWKKRHERFAKKFACGNRFVRQIFEGFELPESLDQVALLQYATGKERDVGGARLVTVREFVQEVWEGLKGKSPASGAVHSTWPLLRTLQLAADAKVLDSSPRRYRLIALS
ncbi:hypothetical protein AYO42_04955 [Rhizomicrobium sp. SCGC AG-212-E05]|nr:hypothetical protein AYO42_04955 [Rhizomicrobium sp. SCGC AG-212-E05]